MIKAIVVDDEDYVRHDVIKKINNHFSDKITVIKEANSVANALDAINVYKPNLLFLDVDLGDGTGFDVLKKTTHKNFEVIFITGFDKHALKAIKVGALDYILKPVDEIELIEAVNKAIDQKNKEGHLEKLIEISSEYFNGAKNNRIILKTTESVYAVYEDDILYCKSDGNYTTFFTKHQDKIVVSKPIKKIEEILSENIFIRCHQSFIVNKKYVTKYSKQGFLILDIDTKVPVSSRRKDYTLKKIF